MQRNIRNSTNFAIENYQYLKNFDFSDNPDNLLYNQFVVDKYLIGNPNQRGLLIFQDYGRGKTRLAAQVVKMHGSKRRVVMIVPSGVKTQHSKTLSHIGITDKNYNIQYIAIKASNLIDQVERGSDVFDTISSLDNCLVIVDEAHNLFNSICNGASNATDLYDMIMNAKNIKLLFLSGSPVTGHPFEFVPCFNMLNGTKLFSESKEEFTNWFITEDGHIKNREKFQNRIMGLMSYYGSWNIENEQNIAERLPIIVKKIPMSQEQYAKYKIIREKELEQKAFHKANKSNDRFNAKTTVSSYRIKSRQACSLVTDNPKHATDKELLDPANSCKFHEAIKIIMSHKNQIGMTGDNLVHHCGLTDFARLLELKGWENWEDEESNIEGTSPRFALITGDQDAETRTKIQDTVSAKNNITGKVIRNVLVGPAGSEGLSFHHGRYVILMSSYFNMTRNYQFIYRFVRKHAHDDLKAEDQNVQPYLLLADYPNDEERKKMGEPTTDIFLYEQSKKMQILILEFYKAAIEVSIDCGVHRDNLSKERQKLINCKMCTPDNKPLWQDKIDVDMQTKDPCKPLKEESIDAKEIIIEDANNNEIKYMYTILDDKSNTSKNPKNPKNPKFEFFEFQPKLNMYVKVQRNNPNYHLLYQAAKDN